MTGRYQYRLPIGLEEPLLNRPVGLPLDHPTLPSLLRASGYQTALVGKWHLGALPDYGPLQSVRGVSTISRMKACLATMICGTGK